MGMWLRVVRVVPVALVFAASAGAQSGVVDEATFTITRAGAPFGTESFRIIRRLGSNGIEYLAQCTRTMEGRIVKTALTIDSAGNPTTYTRATTGGIQTQMTARNGINRLTVNEEGRAASSRDYPFGPGMLILDDDILHQLYFVTWRDPRAIGFVAPQGRATGHGTVTEVGRENIMFGRTAVPAIHYAFGDGDRRREIWIDSDRRLLKVSDPARQIVGTRDRPPR